MELVRSCFSNELIRGSLHQGKCWNFREIGFDGILSIAYFGGECEGVKQGVKRILLFV